MDSAVTGCVVPDRTLASGRAACSDPLESVDPRFFPPITVPSDSTPIPASCSPASDCGELRSAPGFVDVDDSACLAKTERCLCVLSCSMLEDAQSDAGRVSKVRPHSDLGGWRCLKICISNKLSAAIADPGITC